MGRKEWSGKLRRARREIDQVAAEVAIENSDVLDEQARKDVDELDARLLALKFRVDAIGGI